MGIEIIIFTAHLLSRQTIDAVYSQRPTVEVQVLQQVQLQQQDMNTRKILEAIKKAEKK